MYSDSRLWFRDGRRKRFTVYVLSNTSMTLYTGVTNDIRRRLAEHFENSGSSFVSRYHFDPLVYLETWETPEDAIWREKQIKGLTRAKKIALIKTVNPEWSDLRQSL